MKKNMTEIQIRRERRKAKSRRAIKAYWKAEVFSWWESYRFLQDNLPNTAESADRIERAYVGVFEAYRRYLVA